MPISLMIRRARLGLQWGKASLVLNFFNGPALVKSTVIVVEQLIGVGVGLRPAPTPVHILVDLRLTTRAFAKSRNDFAKP